jgi:hypothetical protein
MTQITLNAATMHFRSGAACPLVLRLPSASRRPRFLPLAGAGVGLPLDAGVEGPLSRAIPRTRSTRSSRPARTTTPSSSSSTRASTAAASTRSPGTPATAEVWHPKRIRSGGFATLVTYGEAVHLAAEACEYLAAEYEAEIEVFDLRCLSPLDLSEIIASVGKDRPPDRPPRGPQDPRFRRRDRRQDHRGQARAAQGAAAADSRARPAGALRPRARGGVPAVEGQGDRAHHGVDVVKRPSITRQAWARVRLFAMDVDGILTDGTVSSPRTGRRRSGSRS